MDNEAEIVYKRGIEFFETGQYESAVLDLIRAYDLGYERELILQDIYQCFVVPNEQEFRSNFEKNCPGFTKLPYDACTLDFIPVSEGRFYIFDREEEKFCGLFVMEEVPVQGKTFVPEIILYMDVWDVRKMLPDMKENFRSAVYVLLGKLEPKFASFLKLPDFAALYLRNVLAFHNEELLCAYLSQCGRDELPQKIVADTAQKYVRLIGRVYKERLHNLAAKQTEDADWLVNESGNGRKVQIVHAMYGSKDTAEWKRLISEYEAEYSMDFDLYVIKAWYYRLIGETEAAYNIIRKALRKNPYHFAANKAARILCVETGRYAEAVKYDSVLMLLNGSFHEVPAVDTWKAALMDMLLAQYHMFLVQGDEERAGQCRDEIEYLEKQCRTAFGFNDHDYGLGDLQHLVGTVYETAFGKKYAALYRENPAIAVGYKDSKMWDNWMTSKLECMETVLTDRFTLGEEGEYLLPVLEENKICPFQIATPDGKEIICQFKQNYHFEYFRLPPSTVVTSEQPLRFGSPILLKQDPAKKKLILNIFVDGISQKVIEEEGLEKLMPFTDAFFSKGVKCRNAYTAGEWTLPSVASYTTGASTVNHMLIHNNITNMLPADFTVLAEYFKEQGYQTAKIDGDWRSCQSYGYGRGIDRILYQYQYYGMRVEQVTADVLEHMELMKETNQYIWMCAGDLHDVADGLTLRPSVSADIPLENRGIEEIGETSVKQNYSQNKRVAYIKQMKYIDRYLGILYHYIEENYKDDEIVVSLFGDHGQGYLVGNEEHFLSAGRSKVGMMFRGGGYHGKECREIISTCDYLPIMCSLAGIPLKDEGIDGILPTFFGGEKEREYAITESIHPGDPYQAAVVSKEYVYYLTAEGRVQYDGRFELGRYQWKLLDKAGRECQDAERGKYYFDILMHHVGSLLIY